MAPTPDETPATTDLGTPPEPGTTPRNDDPAPKTRGDRSDRSSTPDQEPSVASDDRRPVTDPDDTIPGEAVATPTRNATPPRIAVRPAAPPVSSGGPMLAEALAAAERDPLSARKSLSEAWTRGLAGDDRKTAQILSKRLADATLLVDVRRSGSPYATPYRIKRGDAMSRIARKNDVNTNLDFVARINGIEDLNRIRENQEIWLPRGVFHLVADRSDGDLAVHQEIDGTRHLLLVIPVMLGRDDLTPDILFQVRMGSKRSNPSWTDPATGVRWSGADPRNPVGEFWIGLEPADAALRGDPKYQGFGLHGTGPEIEFGTTSTSGSIQVREADAEILFELLRSGRSTIDIRP